MLINNPEFAEREEILREKGTNRSQFFGGQFDKYSWVDVGSSYLPGEIVAAFLWAQIEEADCITAKRIAIWNAYQQGFKNLSQSAQVHTPIVPDTCRHNAHMFYLLMRDNSKQDALINSMKKSQY